MIEPEYFDFRPAAEQAGFTPEQLEALFRQTLDDYCGDRMMAELRMLRTCIAVAKGSCTIAEALAPEPDPAEYRSRIAEDEPPYGATS